MGGADGWDLLMDVGPAGMGHENGRGTAHGRSAEMDVAEMGLLKMGGVDEWDLLTNRRCCCE